MQWLSKTCPLGVLICSNVRDSEKTFFPVSSDQINLLSIWVTASGVNVDENEIEGTSTNWKSASSDCNVTSFKYVIFSQSVCLIESRCMVDMAFIVQHITYQHNVIYQLWCFIVVFLAEGTAHSDWKYQSISEPLIGSQVFSWNIKVSLDNYQWMLIDCM